MLIFVIFFIIFSSQVVSAADPDWVHVTAAEEDGTMPGMLRSEAFALRPVLGFVDYQSTRFGETARLQRPLGGLTFDVNVMGWFDSDTPELYLGGASGVLYSRVSGGAESDFLLIPANLKVGYHFGDRFRFSIHGGGNVVYRSVAAAMKFAVVDLNQESLWKMYPNAGFDFEFGLGHNVVFSLRPDWTFGSDDTVFSGVAGLGIMI